MWSGPTAALPRTLLRVAPGSGCLIGVDVGETRVRVELFDLAMAELARAELPLRHHGYDVDLVVRHIADGIASVLRESGASPARLLGVGVGVPGILDRSRSGGAVVHGQTIGWDAVPLEELLHRSVELPPGAGFFLSNGAKALGQAEMWFGGGRGARNAAIVLFGSGVGACLVTDGVIDGGARDSAGEWGHLTVSVRGGAAAVPAAAWRRTPDPRRCWSAGRKRAANRPRTPTRRRRSRPWSPPPTHRRAVRPPTRSRAPSWTRPRSTSARASPT